MGCTLGLMVENMMGNGKMENSVHFKHVLICLFIDLCLIKDGEGIYTNKEG